MTDTRDKLNEAKYFLERLKEINRDKAAFRYNLSAFLSAFCSVTGIMNNEYQKIPGFINWNRTLTSRYFSDKIVSFFKIRRNKSVHIQPVSPHPHQNRINIPELNFTKLAGFSLVAKINDDGIMSSNPILTRLTHEGVLTTDEVTATTFWFFSDLPLEDNPDNKDVVSLCEEQLVKLEAIVDECEQKFSLYQRGKTNKLCMQHNINCVSNVERDNY